MIDVMDHKSYKERLPVKYLKTRHQKPSLDISRWRFLSDILDHEDDDGDPARPGASGGGIRPVDLSSKVRTAARARRAMSKEQACFSRQNAAQQTRRERVAAVERKLLCHPLALYGHYERHMPPELFQQVLSVLDPDMCVNPKPQTSEHLTAGEAVGGVEESTPANENGPGVRSRAGPDEPESVALRDSEVRDSEDIGNMTRRFLGWDASLGSERGDILDKRPAVSFASQVSFEGHHLPNDDDALTGTCRQTTSNLSEPSNPAERKAGSKRPDARYRDPRTRVGTVAETRQNQEVCLEQRFHRHQHQASDKEECRQMFAFQAFMQYLVSNRLRVPEFMSDIFCGEDEGTAEARGTAGARPGLTGAPEGHGADAS